jgi:thiol-disulfide isomerase/thioredoxin
LVLKKAGKIFLLCALLMLLTWADANSSQLPFHPEPFNLLGKWNGKAVLAELFTGSECPPCVAVDLAFDALLERYDSKYLVVLVYHLPIPGPDPMMNTYSNRRQSFYKVRSTPQTFFDGILKYTGGGSQSIAKQKYDQYISLIDPLIGGTTQTRLAVTAVLEEDNVKVTWSSDDDFEDIYYNFALVQNEVNFTGGNGIPIHKMVVRDFKTYTKKYILKSEKKPEIKFNIEAAEKNAENVLLEIEKQRGVKFKELFHKIDRTQLKVVLFLQDKDSLNVYNAIVCDVSLNN